MTAREQDVLAAAVMGLKKFLDPERIILFGSRARGTAGEHSDFDLAVDGTRPERRVERLITDELERAAGLFKVDVVYLGEVEERFKEIILSTGKPVYEK